MHIRRSLFKLSAVFAPIVTALVLGGPITQAAAPKIIIDDGATADGCGSYNGQTAQTDLVTAAANAADNTTILVCPGTYTLTGEVSISGKKKITIKAAVTDPGKHPVLRIASGAIRILYISYSPNTTIDGLVLDGKLATETHFKGIDVVGSAVTVRNTTIIGPYGGFATGLLVTAGAGPALVPVSVVNSYFAGYGEGIDVYGAVKLSVTSSQFDATDGDRITGYSGMIAVRFQSYTDTIKPTGSITKSRMVNNGTGVQIQGASKVSITNNVMADNQYGVDIMVFSSLPSIASTKITGNTIIGTAVGIEILNNDAANKSITKTTISKNTIVSRRYGLYDGIKVTANTTAGPNVTGTISQNTIMGFVNFIVFTNASLTVSNNTIIP